MKKGRLSMTDENDRTQKLSQVFIVSGVYANKKGGYLLSAHNSRSEARDKIAELFRGEKENGKFDLKFAAEACSQSYYNLLVKDKQEDEADPVEAKPKKPSGSLFYYAMGVATPGQHWGGHDDDGGSPDVF